MKNWQNVLDAIDEPFLELTDKDRKVAKYLARGWTFEEIHKLTEIPKSTLTTTAARRIYHRTGCKNQQALTRRYWNDVDRAINVAVYGKRRIQ